MKINQRLKLMGDLVEDKSLCLDIGCDHAFLDIYLVKQNRGIQAVASDIKKGPLEQAKKNIKNEKLEKKIEVRLGDGLDTYQNEDTILISGMGGRTIIGIFKRHLEVFQKVKSIIISPNNYIPEMIEFIVKNGFFVSEERLVKEGKFIYKIIKFSPGRKKYSKKQLFFGPVLLEKKGDLFQEYYQREYLSREIMLKMVPKKYILYRHKIKKEMKWLKEEIYI